VKRLDVVRRFFFPFGIEHRDRLTPEIKRAYLEPNPTAASRTGVLVFLREIPTGPSDPVSHFWGELEDGLERHSRDKPVGIGWGMKDAAFTPAVLDELWLRTFPDAVVTRVPDAGHFVQEDAHERVIPALLAHLQRSRRVDVARKWVVAVQRCEVASLRGPAAKAATNPPIAKRPRRASRGRIL
jgi:pimeloyl-ACP methyl ester carboxylesterase